MGSNFLLHQPVQNGILLGLAPADLYAIRSLLRPTRLVPGQVLIEQGQPTDHVYFIEEGVTSLLAEVVGPRAGVQVAMIGREGFVGGHSILDADAFHLTSAIVQIPGLALQMTMRDLLGSIERHGEFRRLCLAAVAAQMSQIMQTSASNARDTLAARCVRWLLMVSDRVGDELAVTHEALSAILGVRRSGITATLTGLQDEGIISARRGRIKIRNRTELERLAGMPTQADRAAGWPDWAGPGATNPVTPGP